MNTVEVSQASKSFNGVRVVDNVSFGMERGEIFGMVGPNGAGKTTTIRMLLDIVKPDSGETKVLGESLKEDTKNRIGYLPEERAPEHPGVKDRISQLENQLAWAYNKIKMLEQERGKSFIKTRP